MEMASSTTKSGISWEYWTEELKIDRNQTRSSDYKITNVSSLSALRQPTKDGPFKL